MRKSPTARTSIKTIEVRTYLGWDPTTHSTTGPIEVSREYRPAAGAASGARSVYDETFTTVAIPSFNATNDTPTGKEVVNEGNIQSLTRTISNDAGQTVETDQYFSLAGVTDDVAAAKLGAAGINSEAGNYLATTTRYDQRGRLNRVVSPTGTITRTVCDGLGRAVSIWIGPTAGQPSGSPSNQKRYSYGALGETTTATDPNGTTHSYTYDVLGRQVSDAVTTVGTGVDSTVLRLTTAYDSAGNASLFTSYSAASGGQVVNQVERVYNGLGQLTDEYQSHEDAVDRATTPRVRYVYAEMAGGQNNSRPVAMIYANGRVVDYVYNSGIDGAISRVSALDEDNGGTPGTRLETYDYLGLDTIVKRGHPESGVDLSYIQQGDPNANADGGDQYTGLDRFGRVIDQNWIKAGAGTATDRFQYGYDRDGNRLYQANLVETALSELYHANRAQAGDDSTAYDALGRLTGFARGTLSSSGNNGASLDTVVTPTHSQSWQLDALGNWTGESTDNATPTTKTFNAQNQTTHDSAATAPTYDHDGNTTNDGGHAITYDAWNRAIVVSSAATSAEQVRYAYDALGRRIIEATAASGAAATESVWIEEGTDYENAEWSSSGAGWSFTLGGGLTADGSGFTLYAAGAPAGAQVAFLQGLGSFSQQVDDWAAGSYAIGFLAAQRGNYLTSHEDFQVEVDGNVVGTFTPTGTTYAP